MVAGCRAVEKTQTGNQSVTLNRIVVPAHLRIVPLEQPVRPEDTAQPPANCADAPKEPQIETETAAEAASPNTLKRLGIAAAASGCESEQEQPQRVTPADLRSRVH